MLLLTPFHRASRIKSVVRKIMLSGSASVLGDYKFMQTASPLFVRFEALATKLMSLAHLNRTVHLPTYNRLIGEAALAIRDA
jgi:hypothetical protein